MGEETLRNQGNGNHQGTGAGTSFVKASRSRCRRVALRNCRIPVSVCINCMYMFYAKESKREIVAAMQ